MNPNHRHLPLTSFFSFLLSKINLLIITKSSSWLQLAFYICTTCIHLFNEKRDDDTLRKYHAMGGWATQWVGSRWQWLVAACLGYWHRFRPAPASPALAGALPVPRLFPGDELTARKQTFKEASCISARLHQTNSWGKPSLPPRW